MQSPLVELGPHDVLGLLDGFGRTNSSYAAVGCVILPKVLKNIGTRQFPIPLDPKTSPSEKFSKNFQIYYWFKPVEVLLYDLLIAILVQSLRLKKIYEGVGLPT